MGRRADYDFGKELGRGSFGVVHRVRRIKDGRNFVCKQIQLQNMTKKAREEANLEVTLLRRVSSGTAYIVEYIDSFLEGESLHIIMEFCENGDLSSYLKGRGGVLVPERTVWKFLIQIGLGLQWLHHSRILHRDIKTLNVFLTSADDVRLGDLGVARVLSHNTQFANTFVGTPYYLSPELCEEKPYNEKSDVWAYGCVIYEMCNLRHPFDAKNHAALLVKILRGQYAPIHTTFSDELRDVIDGCMRREYHRRPTLTQLLSTAAVRSKAAELGIVLPELSARSPGCGDEAGLDDGEEVISPIAPPRPEPRAQQQKPGSPADGNNGCGRPPLHAVPRSCAGKGRIGLPPSRRAAPDRGSRGRVRGATGNSGVKIQVISAPPSALAVAQQAQQAQQANRNAPSGARAGGGPASRPPLGQPSGGEGLGPPIRRPPPGHGAAASAEERRRAAREVAALPDFPGSGRQQTRRPSVGSSSECSDLQGTLTSLDASRPWSAEAETTLSPEEILRQAQEEPEATLLVAPGDEAAPLPGAIAEEDGEDEADQPPSLRLLRKIGTSTGRGTAELTCQSAFDGSRRLEDSLMYTADDSLMNTTAVSDEGLDDDEGFDEDGGDQGLGTDVVMRWGVTGDDDGNKQLTCQSAFAASAAQGAAGVADGAHDEHADQDASDDDHVEADALTLSMSASFDVDGLLCDTLSANRSEQRGDAQEDVTEVATDAEAADLVAEELTRRAQEEEEQEKLVQQEASVSAAPRKPAPDPRLLLERRVRSLSLQIKRQYARVVEGLDEQGRIAWDELYNLFQAKSKLSMDLSDEDQDEFDRYVFEQLPTESTDLMWDVYKVLHLEQERDQCEKKLKNLEMSAT